VRVLIVYATKYGTVEGVAESIREKLSVPCDLANLKATPAPPIDQYDVVLTGGSIYAGRIRPAVSRFCEHNQSALLARKVGLFISCLFEDEQGRQQFEDNFPGWLLAHAFGRYNVGGAVHFSRLKLVDKIIMQKVGRVSTDLDQVKGEEIDHIVSDVHELAATSR
jgi:menaquinone-dependent protoporphyrinogen oxidase